MPEAAHRQCSLAGSPGLAASTFLGGFPALRTGLREQMAALGTGKGRAGGEARGECHWLPISSPILYQGDEWVREKAEKPHWGLGDLPVIQALLPTLRVTLGKSPPLSGPPFLQLLIQKFSTMALTTFGPEASLL